MRPVIRSPFRFACLIGLSLSVTACNQIDTGISHPYPNCFDNIQNQGELGVDCGGPCDACPPKITAKIDGVPWESEGQITTSINNNSIIFLSGNGSSNLSFIYTGPFETGTYNLQSAIYTNNVTQQNYISNQGTIKFVIWDNNTHTVSGTFSFTAFETSGAGDTIQVTNGVFQFIPY
jgi:hypothetical protein